MPTNETLFNRNHHQSHKRQAIEIIQLALLIPVLIIGTVGNQLAIFVFGWKKRRTRKRFETLLLLLALCDFLASSIAPPLFIYAILTHFNAWHFGYLGCKVFLCIGPVNVTISHGILVLIAYERYRSVANPLGDTVRKSIFYSSVLAIFLVSLILVAPYSYSLEIFQNANFSMNTCVPRYTKRQATHVFAVGNVCRDVIASVSIISLGVRTARKMNSGKRKLIVDLCSRKKRRRATEKATKMLIVVAALFSVCVIPLDLFQVIHYTLLSEDGHSSPSSEQYSNVVVWNTFLQILQMSNSATNIVVYSRMHRDFTRGVLACGRKGNKIIRASMRRVRFRSMFSLEGSLDGELDILNDGGEVQCKKVVPLTKWKILGRRMSK